MKEARDGEDGAVEAVVENDGEPKAAEPISTEPDGPVAAPAEEDLSSEVADALRRYAVPSLAVAGGLGLLELLRARFQQGQVFSPLPYPTGIWDPKSHGLDAEDVWFEAEDGVRLHGWWIRYREARATVVYCHGNSGNLGDRVDIFRKLRRLRVHIFAFDYRGYGRSDGEPSEKGLFADVRAACDQVRDRLGVDPRTTLLFGHSLGGAVAIDGALHRPVAGLVVQSSFTDLDDMARHFYPKVPMHLITRNGFRSIDKVGRLTMPKLFLHGTDDPTVPFELGQRLHRAAAKPKEWFPVAGAGHNDIYKHGGLKYFRALSRFRERCLRG